MAMSTATRQFYEFGPFRLDRDERLLYREGEPVQLTPKALDTLFVLVESGGKIVEKDELMKRVWPDSFVEEANLAVNVSQLRKALGETGKSSTYIETVPRRGYRFVARVREVAEEPRDSGALSAPLDEDPTLVPAPRLAPPSEAGADDDTSRARYVTRPLEIPAALRQAETGPPVAAWFARNRRKAGVAALLVLLAALPVVGYFTFARRGDDTSPRRVAILPFRNLKPDPNTDFLSIALADAITTRLGYVRALVVRPSSYVYGYKDKEIDPRQAAKELGVEALLIGNYFRDGDDLRISAQLIDVRASEPLWTGTIDRKYDKLASVQDSVAREIINGLHLKLTPGEARRFDSNVPQNPLAYEYYLRGVERYNADDLDMAIELLERSLALDANHAASWAYLGEVYTITASTRFGGREHDEKAQNAFEKALAIDPESIEARMWLAGLYTNTNRVEKAVPLLREVLEAKPNHAQAHWELSYAYRYAGMLEASIEEGERTRQLDSEVRANNSVFNSYFYAGQYDRFINSVPAREDSGYVTFYRGLGYLYLKDLSRALADFDRAYELNPRLMATQIGKAVSLGMMGRRPEGLALLRRADKKVEESGVGDAEGIYKLAQGYALLGEKEAALRVLRRSISGGFFCYPYIVNDPLLDSLRGEAEFATLMEMARVRREEFRADYF